MKFDPLSLWMPLCLSFIVEAHITNNGCDCDSLVVTGRDGDVKGNCQSIYNWSAWCYLPMNSYNTCIDKTPSTSFQGRQWSIEACRSHIKSVPQFDDYNDVESTPPPNPPINLNITIISGEAVKLQWDPPFEGNFSSFKIQMIPLSEPKKPYIAILTRETTYELQDLTPGATYEVQLHTVYNGKESGVCAFTNFTTRPNTPGKFIVWFRNETTLLALWQPPQISGVYTDYKVTIDPPDANASEVYIPIEGNLPGPAQAAFNGLVPGKGYNISVSTISEGQTSDPTTAQYRTVPLKPTNVSFDPTTIGTDFFTVKWNEPHKESIFDSYQVAIGIRRRSPQIIERGKPLMANFTENLRPGRTYQMVVKTVSGSVASWPARGNVTTRPLPVTNLHWMKDLVTNNTKLAWKPHPKSLQDIYKVLYNDVEIISTTSDSILIKDEYLSMDNLSTGSNQIFEVRAVSNAIESEGRQINQITS